MIEINLLPGSGKKSRSRGASKLQMPAAFSGFSGASFTLKDKWLVGAIACAVVAIGAIGSLYLTQSKRENAIAESLDRAAADSVRYAGVLRDRVRAEATRDTVLRQLNIIRSVDGERFIWPHVLDEVSRSLPQYTWLTSVTFVGTAQGSAAKQIVASAAPDTAKKAGVADTTKKAAPVQLSTAIPLDTVQIRIAGQTVDIQALTRFMRDLEQSPFLERVQLEKSELVLVGGKEATQFSLLTLFARPDSTAVRRMPLAAVAR